MTEPQTTASCANSECTEFEVPKDFSGLPYGYPDPVWCGMCGQEIDISGVVIPEPAPRP